MCKEGALLLFEIDLLVLLLYIKISLFLYGVKYAGREINS